MVILGFSTFDIPKNVPGLITFDGFSFSLGASPGTFCKRCKTNFGIRPSTLHHRVSKSKSLRQVPSYIHASSRKRQPHKFSVGKCTSSYTTSVSPEIKLTSTTSKSESELSSVVRVLLIISNFRGCRLFLLVTNDDSMLLLVDDS